MAYKTFRLMLERSEVDVAAKNVRSLVNMMLRDPDEIGITWSHEENVYYLSRTVCNLYGEIRTMRIGEVAVKELVE